MSDYSVSPAGEKFALPKEEEYDGEFQRVLDYVQIKG